LFFLFFAWKEEDARRKCLKQKGRSRSQKWEGKAGVWRKAPSLLCIFFCYFFVCFVFFVLEKKKTTIMCRCLFLWCCWNKEGDGNKLLLPSPLCLRRRRRRRRRRRCGNALLFYFIVVL
jgi:hypothetical protein